MDPVFVKSSTPIPSYFDFWRLVELSGFQVVDAAHADLSRKQVSIWPTFDGEFMEAMERTPKWKRGGKAIFWNLERPDGCYRGRMDVVELFRKGTGEILEFADAIWVLNKDIEALDSRNIFAVLGGHPGLRECGDQDIVNDVLHLGQNTPRRAAVLLKLKELNVSIVQGTWGEPRARALASSKLMLAIDRVPGLHLSSPLRYVLAAAYGLPILSEETGNPYPLEPSKTILMAKYDDLPNAANALLRMPMMKDVLTEVGEACRKLLCEDWTFRRGVMDALGRTT